MKMMLTNSGIPARSLWSLDDTRIHMNHGSYGGITKATAEFQMGLIDQMRSIPGRWFAELPDRLAETVDQLSELLGIPAGFAVPVPNASAAATVAFRALDVPAGATVLTNNHNYGAVVHAVRRVLGDRVSIRELGVPLGATDAEVVALYEEALTVDVAVLLLDQFSSSTAMAFPITELVQLARAAGVAVVVDGAHAPGLIARPLPDPMPDAWFGNLHKHLCAPLSGALLVMSEELQPRTWPLIASWNEHEPYERRFLVQGAHDATAVLSASKAYAELEEEFGWAAIRQHAQGMTNAGRELLALGIEDLWGFDASTEISSPTPGFAMLRLPALRTGSGDQSAVFRAMLSRTAGIEAMVVGWGGDHYLRLCSHAYTTKEDYDALASRGLAVLEDCFVAPPR